MPRKKGGEKTMNYEKPQVVVLGSAVEAIQNSQNKPAPNALDGSKEYSTNAAYEADE
jgi:hypothetical protein